MLKVNEIRRAFQKSAEAELKKGGTDWYLEVLGQYKALLVLVFYSTSWYDI